VPAVVALAAGDVGANDHSISHPQVDSFEVGVLSVSANRSDGSDIFMALNNWKFQFPAAVLRGVTLKRVLVRSANAGHLHFDDNTTRRRFRQGIFSDLIMPGLD